jgi:hypothetical protein
MERNNDMAIEAVAQSSQLQASAPASKSSGDQETPTASVTLGSGKTEGATTSASTNGNGQVVDIYA